MRMIKTVDSQGIDPWASCDQWDVKQMLSSQCCQQLSAAANNIYYVFVCLLVVLHLVLRQQLALGSLLPMTDKIYFVFLCVFVVLHRVL